MAVGISLIGLSLSGLGWYPKTVGTKADEQGASERPGHISPLSAIETVIGLTFSDIEHLSPEQLRAMTQERGRVILIDAREAEEFEVSRIPGAVRIDPEATLHQFVDGAGRLSGKNVVVYCSIGARSSKLVRRVQDGLLQGGASGVYNLSGGIFRWHNERRRLVDDFGRTDYVHKFDGYWGQLVLRQDRAVSGSAVTPQ